MRDVAIIGIGQTKVAEHWDTSLRHLAWEAIQASIADSAVTHIDALYVGNGLSGQLNKQEHLGALIADFAGLRGIEAFKVEAACASGAAALRTGYMAIASGLVDVAVVVGVEKMTDVLDKNMTSALATMGDADHEASHGLFLTAASALLMQRYMHEHGYDHDDFAHFPLNAHRNAANNPNALFRFPIKAERFVSARMICDPVNLLDSPPTCDGAAAVVLVPAEAAHPSGSIPVRIAASAVGTDALAIHSRRDPLVLESAAISAHRAYEQAEIEHKDVDLFELHGGFSILAALALEAAGFAKRGEGVRLAMDNEIGIEGRVPISTMGGLKARGHPIGATGIYQIVEVVQQLRGLARDNQVPQARVGMAQNIGGSGATAITHILERLVD